jgi:sterol desaturase/sphingolipid hydroxylase (fatty acid hydroxylase superfamily)
MFDIYNSLFIGAFVLLCILDAFHKPRSFPEIRFWKTKGVLSFILAFYLTIYSPFLWDEWLGRHRLFDATQLPLLPSVIGGLFLYELAIYAWHRAGHAFQPMWRWNHQIHHSAERIDVYGALYFHPADIMGFALMGSLTLVMIFGITPEAASIVGFITNLLAIFQHSNLKTPRWLGYFVMRPEAHNLHHQKGVHFKNFGDIPHWDMLFGTFHNPATWDAEAGFFVGASARLPEMLMGRDMSRLSGRDVTGEENRRRGTTPRPANPPEPASSGAARAMQGDHEA